MKKYESYKDSGVEWIGEIPSHWNRTKGKYILEILTGNYPSEIIENEEGIPFVKVDDLNYTQEYHFLKGSNLLINPLGLTPLDDNIIIFPKRGMTIYTNKVVVCRFKSFIDPNLMGVKVLKNCNTLYVKYLIQSRGLGDICDSSTIPQINNKHIYPLEFPYPPLPEQHQIVQYLDTKTTLIDTLIQKTQEKINLLREKRTSLINHTVTKGLNPDVEMKDSGVEWIGKVPKHWEIKKLKYGVSLITEKGTPEQSDIKISPENVESNTGKCLNFYSEYTGEGMRFISGDVLLNKLRLYLKKIILTEYDGYSMGEMIVLRSNNNLNNRYLYYLLFHQGLIDLLDSQSTGVKLPRVSPEIILNSDIVFPSSVEQIKIVEYLEEQSLLIDTLIQKEEKRVELLKEYRQTLISDVVTGKIKVTDYE